MDSSETNQHASLVDLIFGKCAVTYGRDFTGRWEGMSLVDIKADWHRELGGWLNRPHAIKHALEHLPEKPPHVLQFRALCERAPEPALAQLDNAMTAAEKSAADVARQRVMDKIRSGYVVIGKDA